MGTYVFRWPYEAKEVFVTGTFDDWGKTVQLHQNDSVFENEVYFPTVDEKIQYKFVVDGFWTTDPNAREEDDGSHNINNVLLPEEINRTPASGFIPLTETTPDPSVMAGVTPDSTTAALAANVPKESEKHVDLGAAAITSVAPESTTAELAKNVPLEKNRDVLPGTFPDTPQLSVSPIPASNGIGNPVHLNPGEKVPDPSSINANTIESTVRTDKAGYEADASAPVVSGIVSGIAPEGEGAKPDAFSVPPVSKNLIPESSLPINAPATADTGVTISSVAPEATTVALAAAVPLEKQAPTNGQVIAPEVPKVVAESIKEAHQDPEAAANEEAVEEKEEVEEELKRTVKRDNSVGRPAPTYGREAAPDVPEMVRRSFEEAHQPPEAAASIEAVEEKEEVEEELKHTVKRDNSVGRPAPTYGREAAPDVPEIVRRSFEEAHRSPEAAASIEAVEEKEEVEEELKRKVKVDNSVGEHAPSAAQPEPTKVSGEVTGPSEPTATTGVLEAKTTEVSEGNKDLTAPSEQAKAQGAEAPAVDAAAAAAATAAAVTTTGSATQNPPMKETLRETPKKKKNRASGFFSKLKEKFK